MTANRALAAAAILLWSGVASSDAIISGAWVRAMPTAQSMTAGYLTLENDGDRPITVIGASSDASPRVEIHTTVRREGMQRMQQVETLEVAPGERVELAPGGYHLMLRDMPRMPAAGDHVELCLELDRTGPACVTAVVSRDGPATATRHHH
ncbi:copper chaperone PCu(A)C [Chromatocurvus halotolerans]|uniref:Copper(I)-binding protein n=1 Tax=Chromatocurvus halotolerans TaxID=1132028 RepID=A0A4R2KP86_9GAMM|nr:copper chaperone PCu(A)C [Chromatocurvus halotolerans]TCO71878.1 hypothetical protein EV688_12032 [Chromatocurvus halotolerans]